MKVAMVHNDRHKKFRTRKAATSAARACSRKNRGEWCDVVVNGRRVAQCFKGKCKGESGALRGAACPTGLGKRKAPKTLRRAR